MFAQSNSKHHSNQSETLLDNGRTKCTSHGLFIPLKGETHHTGKYDSLESLFIVGITLFFLMVKLQLAKLEQTTGTQKQPYQHVNDADCKRWAHFWGSTQPYRNHSKFSLKKSLLI